MNLKPTRRLAMAAATVSFAGVALSGCLLADNTTQTLAVAGSDTTENVMGAVTSAYNADTAFNTDPDNLVNILSVQSTPLAVPGDANCGTITYHSPPGAGEVASPNGSSSGRDALKASVLAGDGCIDIARSSSGPRAIGSDLATFEYYAYAMDSVGWASASTKAPANLTLAQLQGIYNCTFTDWSQVGGTAGPIKRYWPQAGSGTRSFAQSDLIGFDPTTFNSCGSVTLTQENTGQVIAANGDQESAVVPYSAGNWIAAATGAQPDQRAGQTVRSLNGQNLISFASGTPKPNVAPGPVQETNIKLNNPTPSYPGIRYVFNVIDSTSVNYNQAQRFVGFENKPAGEPDYSMSSLLCGGSYAATLNTYGFAALPKTADAVHNIPASACRLFTP